MNSGNKIRYYGLFGLFILFGITTCSNKTDGVRMDASVYYQKGEEAFKKKRYEKAIDNFNMVNGRNIYLTQVQDSILSPHHGYAIHQDLYMLTSKSLNPYRRSQGCIPFIGKIQFI